jgi:hypothetical protein
MYFAATGYAPFAASLLTGCLASQMASIGTRTPLLRSSPTVFSLKAHAGAQYPPGGFVKLGQILDRLASVGSWSAALAPSVHAAEFGRMAKLTLNRKKSQRISASRAGTPVIFLVIELMEIMGRDLSRTDHQRCNVLST